MDQYRIVYRPDLSLPDRIVEAAAVTWPTDDWEAIFFWSDPKANDLVAMVRYDFVLQVLLVTA